MSYFLVLRLCDSSSKWKFTKDILKELDIFTFRPLVPHTLLFYCVHTLAKWSNPWMAYFLQREKNTNKELLKRCYWQGIIQMLKPALLRKTCVMLMISMVLKSIHDPVSLLIFINDRAMLPLNWQIRSSWDVTVQSNE